MIDGISTEGYTTLNEVYRPSAPTRAPGQPRKSEMKISVWLEENGKTRLWLAEELDVHPGTVDRWCSGLRRPKPEMMAAIETLTDNKVTLQDWLKPVKTK